MSLTLRNTLTDKQKELLERLGYWGKFDLTIEQAAHLIDELIEQQSQQQKLAGQPELLWLEGGELNWIIKEEL